MTFLIKWKLNNDTYYYGRYGSFISFDCNMLLKSYLVIKDKFPHVIMKVRF